MSGRRLLLCLFSCTFIHPYKQGTQLFTGNTAIVSVALMEKKVSNWWNSNKECTAFLN